MSSMRQTCMEVIIFLLSISSVMCSADPTSTSSNTLRQGDTLNFSQSIHSSNSEYKLQFFSSGVTRKEHFLGIYSSFPALWVAHRETPILDNSGVLTIDNHGTLMITHSAGNPIVLYADDGTDGDHIGCTRVATLLDNGNLVFSELESDGSVKKILWESFRYPTDTLLAGMALGAIDKKQALTSWLARKDPSPGAFSLEWDPMELQMVVRRRGLIVWKSGMLKDGIFQYVPKQITFNFLPVVNSDGNSLSFSTNNTAYWRLGEEGSLTFVNFNTTAEEGSYTTMEIMDNCYGYNNNSGCAEWLQPRCRSTEMPKFISDKGIFLRVDTNEIEVGVDYRNASAGPGDCRTMCWEDCDCVAYSTADDNDHDENIGCHFWIKGESQLIFHRDIQGEYEHSRSMHLISSTAAASSPYLTHP